jgi:3',5'-cyclic AMP phosphodiesterase CpdA
MLAAAVASVRALEPNPDAVLISGDLADHAADLEYEQVIELLAPIDAPLFVLPGNYDEGRAMSRHFDVPGADGQPVQYAADLGPMRLVVLDSTRAGEDSGELDANRLAWLGATLADAPDVPTLVALHHPPIETWIPGFDKVGLAPADRRALGEVIETQPQVRRIVAGHMHRTLAGEVGKRNVLAVPSTYVQGLLEFGVEEIQVSAEPSGFAVHAFFDGELVSHVQPVHSNSS